jgi:hypothetical protein
MKRFSLVTTLATALALAATCGALAQAAPDAAKQKELEIAREELHNAAKRVAELSREVGTTNDLVVERRLHRRPVLGVILEPDAASGVRVAAVTPESAAAKAGLRSGDRLVSIDDKAITGTDGEQRLADARARLRGLDTRTPIALGYVRDGRTARAKVTPEVGEPMWMMFDGEGNRFGPRGHVVMRDGKSGDLEVEADSVVVGAVAPQIHREIIRLDRDGKCKDGDCLYPLLSEAFRWNGLNLASVDKQLGRYFGTDHGVLVLSLPRDMGGLQPGDVLQKVDGKAVNTPREAMTAAHGRAPGTAVTVEYLRDRRVATTKITLPERRAVRLPPPPLPPTPPAAPRAQAAPAQHAAPHPPAPPAAPEAAAVPAPPAPPPPEPLSVL